MQDVGKMEKLEITIEELKRKGKGEYLLLDIRDEMSFGYGHLTEAVNVPLRSWKTGHRSRRTEIKKWLSTARGGLPARRQRKRYGQEESGRSVWQGDI